VGCVPFFPPISNRRSRAPSRRACARGDTGALWLGVALVVLSVSAARPVGAAPDPATVSLETYVGRVLADGLQARAAAAELEVADAELRATGAWPNPSAEVSRQANAIGVRAGETQDQLVFSLPFALSGRLGLLRDAAAKDVEAARARLSFARASLRHEATAAFLEATAARRRIDVERHALAQLAPIVAAITAQEKAGEAAGYDRVRIELEMKRLEDQLAGAIADEARVVARAQAMLNPDSAVVELALAEHDLSAVLPGEPLARGASTRGDVRALAAETEAADLQADAAWRALIPEPTLFGGGYILDIGRPERGAGYAVGVEVPIPVFDSGQGGRARAKARGALAEAQHRALVHAAQARLTAALAERAARVKRARMHDAEVVVRAQELLAITSTAYRGGGAALLALVDAERAQREASAVSIDLHLAARLAENDALLLAGAYDDDAPGSMNP
jgi:outer membrane protein, heavy metal efflux system